MESLLTLARILILFSAGFLSFGYLGSKINKAGLLTARQKEITKVSCFLGVLAVFVAALAYTKTPEQEISVIAFFAGVILQMTTDNWFLPSKRTSKRE